MTTTPQRPIPARMARAGFDYAWLGGSLRGWTRNTPDGARHVIVTYEDGYDEGPPRSPRWIAGLYDNDSGDEVELLQDVTLARALKFAEEHCGKP